MSAQSETSVEFIEIYCDGCGGKSSFCEAHTKDSELADCEKCGGEICHLCGYLDLCDYCNSTAYGEKAYWGDEDINPMGGSTW